MADDSESVDHRNPFRSVPVAQFDIGFGPGQAPETHAVLTQAANYVDAAKAQIAKNLNSQIVQASVATDMMVGRIGEKLASDLRPAHAAVESLHEKIQNGLVSSMGTILESALPLGVQIPSTPDSRPVPESVFIRESALAGDLGPAIEKYNREAWPSRFIKDLKYYAVVSNIQAILAPVPNAVGEFNRIVERSENSPNPVLPSDVQSTIQVKGNAQKASGVDAGIATSGTPTTQQGSKPFSVATGQTITVTPGQGIPDVDPPEITPGNHFGGNILFPPGYTKCDVVLALFGLNPPNYFAEWSYGIINPLTGKVDAKLIVHSGTFNGGYDGFWHAGIEISGYEVAFDVCTTITPPQTPIPVPPVYPPTPVPTPVPPTYPPPTPTPTPPKPEQPCIKICKDEPPECPECEYEIRQGGDGICYIIRKGDRPHKPSDKVLASGVPSDSWINTLCKECSPKTPKPPTYPGGSGLGVNTWDIPGCAEFGKVPGVDSPKGIASLSVLLGIRKPDGSLNLPNPVDNASTISEIFVNTLFGAIGGFVDQAATLAQNILDQTGCVSGEQISLALSKSVVGLLNTFTDGAFSFASNPLKQQSNFLCPTLLPGSQSAMTAWLADNIDANTMRCWARAAGERDDEFVVVADACRTKLSPMQMGVLRQRNIFDDNYYRAQIRSAGMIRQDDADNVLQLLKQIPPVSDLVRFMVRDTADKGLVEKFGMDDQFDKKFQDDIVTWSESQGVDPKYMQYAWRAHWSIPAPGQLFEMYHRLRNLPEGDPRHVSNKTIREALVQQDILPFWIDKYLAISFRPLSRIDARRAFQIGSIDKQQLKHAWQEQGYDDNNADILTEFTDRNRLLTLLRSPWINQYSKGEITKDEMLSELTAEGMRDVDRNDVDRRASTKLTAIRRKRCLSAYRKRFLSGEFNNAGILAKTSSLGLTAEQSQEIIDGWQCEKNALGKHFSAATLCQLLEDSLIDATDFIARAERLGWNHDDAVILYRHCQKRLNIKSTLAEEREIARVKRQELAEQRRKKQLAKEAESAGEKMARVKEKGDRATALRNRRMLETAKNLSNLWKSDIVGEAEFVQQVFKAASTQTAALTDEIINALIVTSQNKTIKSRAEFEDAVRKWIDDLLSSDEL